MKVWFISVAIFLLLALIFRFIFYYQNQHPYTDGEHIHIQTLLTEEPILKNSQQQFSVQTSDGTKVKVITGSGPLYHYGDRLIIDGIFTKKEFNNFSYVVLYFPKIQNATFDVNFITKYAIKIKIKAKNLFYSIFPPELGGLLLGIIFGGKEGLSDRFYDSLRTTGVLHVVAASGMNVSFVANVLFGIFGRFVKRQIALIAAIFGVMFYAVVAGLEPSIVRASIMAVLAFAAGLTGRQNVTIIALCLTGLVMLFVSPPLYADVGFQLSFLATLGIVVIKPLIPLGKTILSEDIETTFAAQLATLPVMLAVFGQYGLLSLLVNALVLWTIPILMIIGSLSFVISFLFEPLAQFILLSALPFLMFFEHVVLFFGGLGFTWQIENFPPALIAAYYLLLLALIFWLQKRASGQPQL